MRGGGGLPREVLDRYLCCCCCESYLGVSPARPKLHHWRLWFWGGTGVVRGGSLSHHFHAGHDEQGGLGEGAVLCCGRRCRGTVSPR